MDEINILYITIQQHLKNKLKIKDYRSDNGILNLLSEIYRLNTNSNGLLPNRRIA